MIEFVHLRVHSEYSLVDSVVRIKPLMQSLKERNMPAVAITDESNLFAMVKAYKAAANAGIKLILGADLWVVDSHESAQSNRITLTAIAFFLF